MKVKGTVRNVMMAGSSSTTVVCQFPSTGMAPGDVVYLNGKQGSVMHSNSEQGGTCAFVKMPANTRAQVGQQVLVVVPNPRATITDKPCDYEAVLDRAILKCAEAWGTIKTMVRVRLGIFYEGSSARYAAEVGFPEEITYAHGPTMVAAIEALTALAGSKLPDIDKMTNEEVDAALGKETGPGSYSMTYYPTTDRYQAYMAGGGGSGEGSTAPDARRALLRKLGVRS